MSMAHLLFVRDFEAEIDAERLLAERQAPTHSADDLIAAAEAARAEGHAAGHAEGLEAGRQAALDAIESQRLAVFQALAVAVDDLLVDRAAHRARLEGEMTAFAADLAARVFPELAVRLGPNRVDAEIARVMRRAVGSPSLEIRLAPALAETLAPDLVAMGHASGQTIRVTPDPSLDRTEVHAQWRHGRSRYSFAAICQSVLGMIRRTAQHPTHDQSGPTHD